MFAKTSQSLGVVLRRARASGFLELSDRRLRALPVEAYAPTPEDLDPDEKFWEIVELRSLDATGNLFDELPGDWRSVGTLRQLRVGKNRLCALPEGIFADLPNLEVLDCGDNQIRHLPGFQGCGASLKTLLAPRNRLQAPTLASGLAALEALDVGGNVDLKCLPRLPERLQKVDAENCGLTVVDRLRRRLGRSACPRTGSPRAPTRHCRWLTYLDLRSNGMATYAIPDLPNLSHVFLGHNGLGDVALEKPPTRRASTSARTGSATSRRRSIRGGLQSIDASNNDLGEVPAALGYLQAPSVVAGGQPAADAAARPADAGLRPAQGLSRTRGPSLLPEEAELARPSSSGDDRLDLRFRERRPRPESRGVLDLKGRKLERCPLSRDDARTIRDDLAADDGLDEYVADPRKRALVAKVQVVDASNNDLAQPPEAAVLLELGPALSELKLCRNKLSALPLAALARVPLKRLDCRENAIDRDEFLDAVSPLGAHLTELDASSNRLRAVPRPSSRRRAAEPPPAAERHRGRLAKRLGRARPDPRDKAQRPPRRNLDLGPSAPFAKPIPRVSPRLGGSDHNLGLGDPSPNAARRLRKPLPKPRAARDAADQEALLVLQSKVNDLNSMLRHQDGALSQAKRFALKKQLARANADKIRFERELASR
ncbi:hypothetical protein JL722_6010 [Aureococcus anophagefferens]|nr:hypothetical protein JL722_6010 [Aureococcus anophagefferens]